MSTPDGSMTSASGGNAPVPGVARLVVSSERYSNVSFRKRGPSLGIFETEPSLNLREQNRHASLSPLFPAHHDASPGLRILPRARIHTPPRDSRGFVLRRAHSRGDDENRVALERPAHDRTTLCDQPSDLWHCAIEVEEKESDSVHRRKSFDIRALIVFDDEVSDNHDRFSPERTRPVLSFEESGCFCDKQAAKRTGGEGK